MAEAVVGMKLTVMEQAAPEASVALLQPLLVKLVALELEVVAVGVPICWLAALVLATTTVCWVAVLPGRLLKTSALGVREMPGSVSP
jgi:hypothetical protein